MKQIDKRRGLICKRRVLTGERGVGGQVGRWSGGSWNFGTWNLEPGTWNPGTWNPGTWNPGTLELSLRLGTCNYIPGFLLPGR